MPCDSKELRRTLSLVLALTALLCTFTLAQSVRTSYTPGVDFSKFHTYKWVEIKGHHPDPSLDSQIKQSIDSKLAARGLTKTGDSADLSVDYQIAISEV